MSNLNNKPPESRGNLPGVEAKIKEKVGEVVDKVDKANDSVDLGPMIKAWVLKTMPWATGENK